MSSGSEQDEQMTDSESDGEIQSLGSQSEDEGQDEDDSDSDIGNLEEGDDDSEDDEEDAGLIINEDQSTDDEENASADDDEEEESELDEEVSSEAEDDNEEESNNQDDDGAKKVPNDLRSKILNKIKRRYAKRLGKTLYVRFPHRLPEDTAKILSTLKEFSSRVSKVRRMRQKSARACLVDFENHEEREKGLEELKTGKIDGTNLVVAYPRSEEPDFFEQATEKRLNKITQDTIKINLKKLVKEKGKLKTKIYTPTVIVKNIPPTAQLSEIKELFPQAVDVKVNFAKGKNEKTIATVTMPTPQAATQVKRSKLKIDDSVLQISFSNTYLKKPAAFEEGNASVSSKTPKKGKRKLEETTSESSSPPKKNKINNKPGNPNKKDKNVQNKKPNKKILTPPENDSESPTKSKAKKPGKEMNTDGSNKKPKPQTQNPNAKQTNFNDKKQRKQKNPNAIKKGPNETVEPIVGSDDVPKKQKFGKEQKGTQNQKFEFPVMDKEDRQNKKHMFPIMKKNLQGKGVKSGKVFKNKQFKSKW